MTGWFSPIVNLAHVIQKKMLYLLQLFLVSVLSILGFESSGKQSSESAEVSIIVSPRCNNSSNNKHQLSTDLVLNMHHQRNISEWQLSTWSLRPVPPLRGCEHMASISPCLCPSSVNHDTHVIALLLGLNKSIPIKGLRESLEPSQYILAIFFMFLSAI